MSKSAMTLGQLVDRIRIDRYVAGAWVLGAVLWARVTPGPVPRIAPVSDVLAAITNRGNEYDVATRYRTDVPRGARVSWGDQQLVVRLIEDLDGNRLWSTLSCEGFLAYLTRHDSMLSDVAQLGTAVTFSTPNTAATYDSPSDSAAIPPATTTVSGVAMEESAAQSLEAGTLVDMATRTLLFVPTVYGELPSPNATLQWGGATLVVASVAEIAPDGAPIGARITVMR